MTSKKTIDQIHEQLDELLPKLEAERSKVLASLADEYAERDALIAKIQPLEAKLREVQQVIKKKEQPLRELGQQIAEVYRVKGAKTLRNG